MIAAVGTWRFAHHFIQRSRPPLAVNVRYRTSVPRKSVTVEKRLGCRRKRDARPVKRGIMKELVGSCLWANRQVVSV